MADILLNWKTNKVRWVLLFYMIGAITACYIMFVTELLFDSATMSRPKTLFVTVFFPAVTIIISILCAMARVKSKG